VKNKIIDQAEEWYSSNDEGMGYGKIFHMVQDSYSKSHTVRNEAGEITLFQGYESQDSHLHGHADKHLPANKKSIQMAFKRSRQLAIFIEKKAPWSEVKNWLSNEVFNLSADATIGGSHPNFEKKE
jgi:hypothetical protein